MSEVSVFVRDKNGSVLLAVDMGSTVVKAQTEANRPGEWAITLPVESFAATVLQNRGYGVRIYLDGEILISGPMISFSQENTLGSDDNMITFTGVGDGHVLQDRLVYPDPTKSPNTQKTKEYRTAVSGGPAKAMGTLVNLNAGPSALAARRHPRLALTNFPSVIARTYFGFSWVTLEEALDKIAIAFNKTYRVVDLGGPSGITFQVLTPVDRTGEFRFSINSGTLSKSSIALEAPSATRAIVLGEGDAGLRRSIEVSDPTTFDAESGWNRRIETLVDGRSSNSTEDMTNDGLAEVKPKVSTAIALQGVVSDDAEEFASTLAPGDLVAVGIGGTVYATSVSGKVVESSRGAVKVGLILGDKTIISSQQRTVAATQALIGSQVRLKSSTSAFRAGDSEVMRIMGIQ